ncbi:MAG: hypothetical protein ABI024_07135 [Vicinamibacterales bacterium]
MPLTGGAASSMQASKPVAVSVAPGYDNQPSFSSDGQRILFAGNRDGKQIDVYVFDRRTNQTTQLTRTAENENSPTYLPPGVGDAGGFSVVQTEPDRTQRLWRFNAQGGNPQLVLTEIKPVGYHAWIDAGHLVLFVLGQPATLQIADVKTGKAEIAASDIGRSLHRIPHTQLASFVQREASGEYWIKQIDISTKKIEPLVKTVAGSSDRDYTWMLDGQTILMSAGNKIFSWTHGAADWTEVFDGASHQLGAISRLSVSPTGNAVAIVVAEPKR